MTDLQLPQFDTWKDGCLGLIFFLTLKFYKTLQALCTELSKRTEGVPICTYFKIYTFKILTKANLSWTMINCSIKQWYI